jgi:small subunit ribosomal protein S3
VGQKVHPVGFRLGVIRGWKSKWFSEKDYTTFLQEDIRIRKLIKAVHSGAAISAVEIDRSPREVTVKVYTARPGIVIGRGGQRVDETRHKLEALVKKRVRVDIQEIQQPELDAYLVAESVADQLSRRVAHLRVMKRALSRTRQAGAKGIRISCAGRLGGAEIARRATLMEGRVPLHTLRADIDYGFAEASTLMGVIGVKVWIYRGGILPQPEEKELESLPPEGSFVSPEEHGE